MLYCNKTTNLTLNCFQSSGDPGKQHKIDKGNKKKIFTLIRPSTPETVVTPIIDTEHFRMGKATRNG